MAEEKRGNYRWLLVFWMFLITTIAYMDRVNLGVATKAIESQFHITDVQMGALSTAFLIGYAAFQIPDGRLADRLGPRKILTLCMIWWAVFTSLTGSVPVGLASSLILFLAFRFLLGAGEASMFPSTTRAIATWSPRQERGIANGWIFAGVGAGSCLAVIIAPWIINHMGWRWSFWLTGIAGAIAAVVWYLIARDGPAEHPRVGRAETEYIQAGIGPVQKKADFLWGKALRNRNVLALSASYFTYGYAAYIFFVWFTVYMMEAHHLDLKSGALHAVPTYLAMAICSLLGGGINDFVTRHAGIRAGRAGIALVGMLLAAGLIVVGSRAQSAGLAAVVLAGGAGALYLAQSSFFSASADVGGRVAGTVSGIMNMTNQIAGAITASLTPWIALKFGWGAAFGVAAALCVVGGLIWLLIDPRRTLQTDDLPVRATGSTV